jgi:hypothetical protein
MGIFAPAIQAQMKFRLFIIPALSFLVSGASGQYQNVLIGSYYYPNEPSIMISPKNPDIIVAGANTDIYYYSADGGLTWDEGYLSSPYGVWGDPCIIVDTAGSFYYFHLSNPPSGNWIDRIVCQKSTDNGATWSDGTYMGLNGTKAQDKEWAVIDPATNNIYVTWTQFDAYGSSDPADSSLILFSRSTDGGETWSPAVRISKEGGNCLDSDSTVEGAVPAVGPEGEVYVSWAGPDGLIFTKSTDQGLSWPSENIFVTAIPDGWDYAIPGIYRANGLPVTCCDLSNSPYRGSIYINWSDQRNGLTDTDIFFVKSTDGGTTWSSPLRVNDDGPGKQQFFTWMTVDQANGDIYIVFYDRREHSDNLTDVYMAVSRDGGETFENKKISANSFFPGSSIFFGDYTNISAYNGRVRPIWLHMQIPTPDMFIYTALIDSVNTAVEPVLKDPAIFSMEQNFPNPASGITNFSYKIHVASTATLNVHDIYGKVVATLVDGRLLQPGKYIEQFDVGKAGLAPGFYYFSLVSGEQSVNRKMIVE